MKIYFVMNSVNDAHANKRASDFKRQGHEVRMFGFLRQEQSRYADTEVIGQFTNDMPYIMRISIYLNGLRKLFKREAGQPVVWYYQGFDVALFATLLNPNHSYIYEECDLVHNYISYSWLRNILEWFDKRIIRKSLKTVLTSEGFIEYHYKSKTNCPRNIVLVPNKLSSSIRDYRLNEKQHVPDFSHLRFAFVGSVRYKALLSMADIISRNFPNHEYHFYGNIDPTITEQSLPHRNNIMYHGPFKSPIDLPGIYSNIDVLISTYDFNMNVRYAEPNKLYETIFFRRPIIVSSGTFLASKVKKLGIGYDVNAYSETAICELVRQIESDYAEKIAALSAIDPELALDDESYVNQITQ